MPTRIYYPLLKQSPERFELPSRQSQHLRVLRFGLGESLEVFDGQGLLAVAHISYIDKKQIQLERGVLQKAPTLLTYPMHLIQALTRHDTMDWIIQKATELGVQSITPVISERTQGRLKDQQLTKKMIHWQEVMISAAEQSHLSILPELRPLQRLDDFFSCLGTDSPALFIFDPAAEKSIDEIHSAPQSSQIMIGPEGGFTAAEVKQALAHQAIPLRLHQNILRAETASIAALSICQFHFSKK